MSEKEKHTPGPWEAMKPDGSYHDVIRIYAESEELTPVAICPQMVDPGTAVLMGQIDETTQAAANARLIAAAPDLLAACKAFTEWLDSDARGPVYPDGVTRDSPGGEAIWREWWSLQHALCDKAVDLARAAIAKAEGNP